MFPLAWKETSFVCLTVGIYSFAALIICLLQFVPPLHFYIGHLIFGIESNIVMLEVEQTYDFTENFPSIRVNKHTFCTLN